MRIQTCRKLCLAYDVIRDLKFLNQLITFLQSTQRLWFESDHVSASVLPISTRIEIHKSLLSSLYLLNVIWSMAQTTGESEVTRDFTHGSFVQSPSPTHKVVDPKLNLPLRNDKWIPLSKTVPFAWSAQVGWQLYELQKSKAASISSDFTKFSKLYRLPFKRYTEAPRGTFGASSDLLEWLESTDNPKQHPHILLLNPLLLIDQEDEGDLI